MWIFVLIFGTLGPLQLIYPKAGWWLANFWRFKDADAEPSDFALWMYRLQGAVYTIVAVAIYSWIRN